VGLPEKTKGNWKQTNLQEDGFDHSRSWRELWCRLVELPKIPSVVGYKGIQEGGRHSDGWRGWVEACGATWQQGKLKHGENNKVIDS